MSEYDVTFDWTSLNCIGKVQILVEQVVTAGASIDIDSALSSSSTNPVQNKVIYSALAGKQSTLTFDNTPTSGSTNPVTSGGVEAAIADFVTMQSGSGGVIELDDGANRYDVVDSSYVPTVSNGTDTVDIVVNGTTYQAVQYGTYQQDMQDKEDTLTWDSTPTSGSTNPVTSGGVYTALAGKEDATVYGTFTYVSSTNTLTVSLTAAQIAAYVTAGTKVVLRGTVDSSETMDLPLVSYNSNYYYFSAGGADLGGLPTGYTLALSRGVAVSWFQEGAIGTDSTPTSGSSNFMTSGDLYTELQSYAQVEVEDYGNTNNIMITDNRTSDVWYVPTTSAIKSTITSGDTDPVNSVAVIAYINSLNATNTSY